MDNVIDFVSAKRERQSKQLFEYLKKPNSLNDPTKIDKLVGEKSLSIEDHQFFLGFLAHLEKQEIDPVHLFHSLIKLSKQQFELQFSMNWYTVAQFCLTFLSILKKNEPEQYMQFIELQKFD